MITKNKRNHFIIEKKLKKISNQWASFVVIGLGLFTSGCSNMLIGLPLAQVPRPVIQKEMGIRGGVQSFTEGVVEISPDASARPPVFETDLNKSSGIETYLTILPNPNLQLSGGLLVGLGSGFRINGQYQFLGNEGSPVAGKEVASVMGEVTTMNLMKSGSQNGELGAGGYPWSGKINSSNLGFGGSYGVYRNPKELYYAGAAIGMGIIKGTISQDLSTTGDSLGGEYSKNLNQYNTVISAGATFEWLSLYTTPSLALYYLNVDGKNLTGAAFNLDIHF